MSEQIALVEHGWPAALRNACAGNGLRAVYQPLVDIQRGVVVGYEALIRFDRLHDVTPDKWFAAARYHGCEAQLEAAALATTLAGRADLPPDTFLSVNLGPETLASPLVTDLLHREPHLRGIVLELTEQTQIDSYADVAAQLEVHRQRGALVAIDDAGSGYAGLAHILELRPSILKLDRSLVSGVDRDEAKRALIEMLGVFAGRVDAWVLAEGIETTAELETLRRLDVPLGQGWALGRPAEPWAGVNPTATSTLREDVNPGAADAHTVRVLLEQTPFVHVDQRHEAAAIFGAGALDAYVVALDDHRVPVAAMTAQGALVDELTAVLRVSVSTPVTDAARRALTRPPDRRFEPLVCTDAAGRFIGIIRIERILDWLSRPNAV